MKRTFLGKMFAILTLLTSACTPGMQSADLIPVVIQLGTTHQAIYGGFYAADQRGDYALEGLTVSYIEGGANVDLVSPLIDGAAQFGIMGASTLIAERANGRPIRALATILRRDPVVFFSLASSDIVRLQDFVGKKVLVSSRLRPRLNAMLAKTGISPSEITLVSTGDFTQLYTGEIDVASGLITSTVLAAQKAGHPVNIIFPDNYGVHFYSTTIYATDDYIASSPELVTKFLRATLKGWTFAVENPQSIGSLVTIYNPKADATFETASMSAAIPYVNTGIDHIGWMKPDDWANMLQTMRAEGEVTTSLDIKDVYTMEFIQKIYGETQP